MCLQPGIVRPQRGALGICVPIRRRGGDLKRLVIGTTRGERDLRGFRRRVFL